MNQTNFDFQHVYIETPTSFKTAKQTHELIETNLQYFDTAKLAIVSLDGDSFVTEYIATVNDDLMAFVYEGNSTTASDVLFITNLHAHLASYEDDQMVCVPLTTNCQFSVEHNGDWSRPLIKITKFASEEMIAEIFTKPS